MFAQALIGSIGPVIVFVGGFVGLKLAPSEVLATLPVACMIVGIALFMLPTVRLLKQIGRKQGFILAVLWGIANSIFTAYSIYLANFWLFCTSILLYGFLIAAVQQFRFAAMESVDPSKASQAVSILLLAGLLAAFLGPEIAFWGRSWFATEFVGSFVGVAILLVLSLGFLGFYQASDTVSNEAHEAGSPLVEIAKQPVFIAAIISATVGFSVMSFIMTATPISMHVHNGFDLAETKWVIQSHIIAMYLPSFITGRLIAKYGQHRVLYAGLVAFLLCIFIGFAGRHYLHYWGALILLGIGWNFMFVTATSMLPSCYEDSERFKVQGFNDMVMFSCQAAASLSAGWVIESLGWNTMLAMCVPLILLTFIIIVNWRRTQTLHPLQNS